MILGLDVSTRCIGYCLLNNDGLCKDIGHIDLSKESDLYAKLDIFSSFLCEKIKEKSKIKISIEEPLQRSNNQKVVNLLQRFNGMICSVIYNILNIQPELIRQSTALKLLDIKIPKGSKGLDRKKYILQCVIDCDIIQESEIKYKRTGSYKNFMFDMADAFVIAKAGLEKDSDNG